MRRVVGCILMGLLCTVAASSADDRDPSRVLARGQLPPDSRLGAPRTLDSYFPFHPPATREAWEKRRRDVREQVLVATGLWPMAKKVPLKPVIHGKIDRDDYTIEKVFFASYPGHYVSGNLYRPRGRKGKLPAVLSPHGHWNNGRFYDLLAASGEAAVEREIQSGAEKTREGARFPLQARCAQLARMGCVVFHYDMVGMADSQQITHTAGFTDAEAELRQQSFMGLQTFNSIRALDFLAGLPDVDPQRIGVTGASGGGTQTFILCAIDDRPAAAFPAVMVSTAMQGGCICENCSGLRQDTGNVELAALFAPRPLGMSAARDWTQEIETRGLPELRALYRLYGEEDRVMARAFLQFDHNYNQVSREVMYNWFNKHLHLGLPEPVVEKPFVPVPPSELSVYDAEHPRPADGTDARGLRAYLTRESERQLQALRPQDEARLQEFRRVVGTALRCMVKDSLPRAADVEARTIEEPSQAAALRVRKLLLGRKGHKEAVPAIEVRGSEFDGRVVVWVHPQGKASLFQSGRLIDEARRILDKKAVIVAPDVLLTGEFTGASTMAIDEKYAGYTFGYNRPLLANRVHDILTTLAYAKSLPKAESVHLAGIAEAGPWVLLARSLAGDAVARTAADFHQFQFESVRTASDPMMLPGALKYGGLSALTALSAPGELYVYNTRGTDAAAWLEPAYRSAGAQDRLHLVSENKSAVVTISWLLK
jgi:dienelactone hydrolase